MNLEIPTIKKQELKNLMIIGCHLHQWQGEGTEGIKNIIKNQGMVQLDTINPAGRNHDIFCFSRLKDYQIAGFEQVCFGEKIIFEDYFPNLYAIHRSYFPLFYCKKSKEFFGQRLLSRFIEFEKQYPQILDEVLTYVKKHGPTLSSDLKHLGMAKPEFKSWRSNRVAGIALDFLWKIGKLVVFHRAHNFKKIYEVTESIFTDEELIDPKLTLDELSYKKIQLKIRSYPVIKVDLKQKKNNYYVKNKWLSTDNLPLELFFDDSEVNTRFKPVIVKEEEKNMTFLIPSNWRDLIKQTFDTEMRAIAPLDPLIYDRNLLKSIFDFEYIWEVYKPVRERRWGYYVYPLLYKGDFIGRFEVKIDKKLGNMRITNFQPEKGIKFDNNLENALICLLNRWKKMVCANKLELDNSLEFIRFTASH